MIPAKIQAEDGSCERIVNGAKFKLRHCTGAGGITAAN
jgi:hypothetical protein